MEYLLLFLSEIELGAILLTLFRYIKKSPAPKWFQIIVFMVAENPTLFRVIALTLATVACGTIIFFAG